MVTQLQDVANNVAQDKISNQRLRNEEIRRQMANPWTEPTSISSTQGTQPLQNVTSGTPTLVSTYSGLLKNYQNITSSNTSRTEGNSFDGSYAGNPNPFNIPSWAPMAVGTALNFADAGIGAPLGAAATSLMRGDRAGAVGTLAGLVTNDITEGKIPGLGGIAGTLASGLTKGKDFGEMAKDAAWTFGKSVLTKAVPGLGLADFLMGLGTAGVSALTGKDLDWNPRRGLEGLFAPNTTQPSSWQGGFFDPGYRQQSGSYITSGNENYSPYGGSQYNRVPSGNSSTSSSSTSSGYPSTVTGSGFDSSTWG